jgi:hypothetical protein
MGDYGEYITQYGLCPSWALSLGYGGVAAGAVLSNWGSAVSWIFVRACALSLGMWSFNEDIVGSIGVEMNFVILHRAICHVRQSSCWLHVL